MRFARLVRSTSASSRLAAAGALGFYRRAISTAMLACCIASSLPPALAAPDFKAAADEALGYLKSYIKIDTTNPPGNEEKGAAFLAKVLNDNGIEAKLYQTAPGRACVYGRLKGTGKKKAVILLNHIDVVPARATDWQHDPFSGEIFDGEIWGRGVIDMKGMGIAELEAMLLLKRSGKTLDRDVVFLATPDEEVGGKFGAQWFVDNQPELFKDAEFLFNEGGFIEAASGGKAKYCGVAVSEKSVLWLSLLTKGEAGHASMPISDSSVHRLVRALNRVLDNQPAPTVLPAVREYFKQISAVTSDSMKSAYADIESAVKKPEIYCQLLKDKFKSSMLRNTISPTVLKAGYKTNVIPAEAEAELDCRLLPGVKKDEFIGFIKGAVNDPSVQINVLDWVHTDESPHNTEAYQAVSSVMSEAMPGVPVVPMYMPWFTDSHWFRDKGVIAYGFAPFRVDPEHLATMHGKNERLPVEIYSQGVELFYKVMDRLCSAP